MKGALIVVRLAARRDVSENIEQRLCGLLVDGAINLLVLTLST